MSGSEEAVLVMRMSRLVPVLILTATAIPAQLGPPTFEWWRWEGSDIVANILLYIPLGLTLRESFTAVGVMSVAASLSATIELAQLFYTNRISHPSDVAANIIGALVGYAVAQRLRTPAEIGLSRARGVAMLVLTGIWILSTRTFGMYVGRFGWFAREALHPWFWSLLPRAVVDAGVDIHELGVLANTAIGSLLGSGGVIALLQIHHHAVRAGAAATVGFFVGNVVTPHLNVFPLASTMIGVTAGLTFSACCGVAAPATVTAVPRTPQPVTRDGR